MSNSKDLVVLVEDEEALGEGLLFNFEAEGYEVQWQNDGIKGMKYIAENHASTSLIVLDLMLPGLDGFEILKRTREIAERIPIIVLSAKSLESDKLHAFELGADDYVIKPFSLAELLMRMRTLIKKSQWYKEKNVSDSYQAGDATFFPEKLVVKKSDGVSERLSPTEGLLLQTFIENENKILTRADLLDKVWNQQKTMQTRTVDVFVSKLRKHIETDAAAPRFLLSLRSVGYAYVTDPGLRKELENKSS